MVERVTSDRQPPPLDGVGEDHTGSIGDGVALAEGVDEHPEVVTGEVLDQRREVLVGHVGDQIGEGGVVGAGEEARAEVRAAMREERLILLVRHRIDVASDGVAARAVEGGLQPGPVLGRYDVPAGALEELHQLLDLLLGDHPVEALTVGVDDQHHVAEPLQRRVGDRLPHVALVQLGVTGQGDEPRRSVRRRATEVLRHVATRRRGEQGRNDPETDRAGGEVEDVGVLGAAGVRLQPAQFAQPGEVRAVELAGQVLDGVEDR